MIHCARVWTQKIVKIARVEYLKDMYLRNALSIFASVSISLVAHAEPKFLPQGVVLFDEATDPTHPELKDLVITNPIELSGKAGVDDDQNGFVDDIFGWNLPSKNGAVMPVSILNHFLVDPARSDFLLKTYSQFVCGSYNARVYFINHPDDYQLAYRLQTWSHGTHTAGIVAKQSQGLARLRFLNILTPDEARASLSDPLTPLLNAAWAQATLYSELSEAPGSFWDDDAAVEQNNKDVTALLDSESSTVVQFLKVNPVGVVSASLHVSNLVIESYYEAQWQAELKRRGLPATTQRTPHQESNFQKIILSQTDDYARYWKKIVETFPNTLFVSAAGNSRTNNDEIRLYPANLSMDHDNVIAVAAVDTFGDQAKFSSFGKKSVSIGAPGVCIGSLAPTNLHLYLTGTSMATPAVSGVAARIRALKPSLTAAQVKAIILSTGTQHESLKDRWVSGAELNGEAAVKKALGDGPL